MAQRPASPEPSTFVPVLPEERIVVLDVLRGFALLGIAIMNMGGFSMPWDAWAFDPRLFPGFADRAAEFFMTTFFSGKANSIFSFLFGLGLTIQMRRAEARGEPVAPMYARRLLVLFLVGAAHAILIWNGDVLHNYAVLGLLLLALRRAPDRWILGLTAVSFFTPLLRGAYAVYTHETPIHTLPEFVARAHENIRIFQHGTYMQQVGLRLSQTAEGYALTARFTGPIMWYLTLTTTMLLGFYAGRHRLLSDTVANTARIRKVMWWCLALGITVAASVAVINLLRKPVGRPTLIGLCTGLLYSLNRPLLCVAYVSGITLLLQRPRFKRFLLVLAAPGRMPLSNYLMQSVIATTLFNSYGFGLFGRVGPLLGLLISFALFAVQVVYSRWWLARFSYGPLEWLWRAAAYGRFAPMHGAPPKKPLPSPLGALNP